MTGKPNVYGSIFRFEGQVSVFWADRGPCYRCLFPEPPPPGLIPSCAEGGVFGVLPGTIGTLQATEALKLLLDIGSPLIGQLLLYDALDMSFQTVQLKKNPECKVCSSDPQITELIDYEAFCGVPGHDRQEDLLPSEWEIEAGDLAGRIAGGEQIKLIDVREPHELRISAIEGATLIPLGSLACTHARARLGRGDRPLLQIRIPLRARPGAAGWRRFPQTKKPARWDQCLGAGSRSNPAHLLNKFGVLTRPRWMPIIRLNLSYISYDGDE